MKQFEDIFSFMMWYHHNKSSKKKKPEGFMDREVQELKNFLDGFKSLKK